MTPIEFPEANDVFGPPEGMDESHVQTIRTYGAIKSGGAFDGSPLIITCWKPTPEELIQLNTGMPIYISFLSDRLPPHMLSMSFEDART